MNTSRKAPRKTPSPSSISSPSATARCWARADSLPSPSSCAQDGSARRLSERLLRLVVSLSWSRKNVKDGMGVACFLVNQCIHAWEGLRFFRGMNWNWLMILPGFGSSYEMNKHLQYQTTAPFSSEYEGCRGCSRGEFCQTWLGVILIIVVMNYV